MDSDDFIRQEAVNRRLLATAGWLLAVALACIAALTVMACQQ